MSNPAHHDPAPPGSCGTAAPRPPAAPQDRDGLQRLLRKVAAREVSPSDAVRRLTAAPAPPTGAPGARTAPDAADRTGPGFAGPGFADPGFADLGFARLDTDRTRRTGDPETVFAQGKTVAQTLALLRALAAGARAGGGPALATRLPDEAVTAVRDAFGASPGFALDETARCVRVGPAPPPRGTVCVVSAGTSDAPVAAEAAFVARTYGSAVSRVEDVGVAGVHRVLAARSVFDAADCVVVVAGMDGALPGVVAGLTGVSPCGRR